MKTSDMKFADGGDARGDCMVACLASVLSEPYDARFDAFHDLMNRVAKNRGDWLACLEGFALGLGYQLRWDTVPSGVPTDRFVIAGGDSPRGCKAGHAVVVLGPTSHAYFDPHPSRAGLSSEAQEWYWFDRIGEPSNAG